MKKYKQVAIKAAQLAGKSILKNYNILRKKDIHLKGKNDLVTKADMEANRIIIRTIKKEFPSHDFLSEETGFENNYDKYKWVIDPLDGTTNYTIHNPLFCTAIALVHNKEILLSVIYAPFLDEFYYTEKGRGAFMNNKKIHVSKTKKLESSIILLGRSHRHQSHVNMANVQKNFKKKVLNMRILGSGSLDLAYVASGRVEACLLVPPSVSLWDSAAGVLLVQEAGGQVTDFNGKPWKPGAKGVFATNKLVHKKLFRAA